MLPEERVAFGCDVWGKKSRTHLPTLADCLFLSFLVSRLAEELHCGRLLSARHLSGKSSSSQQFPVYRQISRRCRSLSSASTCSHGVHARIQPSASKPLLSFHFSRIRSMKAERSGVDLAPANARTHASITVTSGS